MHKELNFYSRLFYILHKESFINFTQTHNTFSIDYSVQWVTLEQKAEASHFQNWLRFWQDMY